MTMMDDIANVVRFGGCVVMGMGVTPERYRVLLQDAASQDYMVIGPKGSQDAHCIASRMSGEAPEPTSLTVSGLEMTVYLIRTETRMAAR